jgi:hypothetical protein
MIRRGLIALALLVGLVIGLLAALPWLAEPALRAGLQLAGANDVHFERLRLGWGEIELDGVAVGGPDHELARLRVTYRLPDLLSGRLDQVEIDGLVVRARLRDGRLEIAGFETPPDGDKGELPPLPYAEQVVVRNARFELATGFGRLQLPLFAEIRPSAGRIAFTATVEEARLGDGDQAIRARLDLHGDVPRGTPVTIADVRANGTLAIDADGAPLADLARLAGTGTIAFDLDRGRLHAQAPDLALSVERVAPAPWQARLGEGRIELTAEGDLEALRGTLGIKIADAGWSAEDVAVSGASLRHRLDWAYSGRMLTLAAREPGALRIESVTTPEDGQAGPVQLRLEPDDQPLLELAIGAPARWRQSLSAAIETVDLQVAAPAPLRLQSGPGTVAVDLEGHGTQWTRAQLRLADVQVRMPEYALALDGIATDVGLTPAGLAGDQKLPVTVGRISHGGTPPWFAPLAFEGQIMPGAGRLAFEGALRRIAGGLSLTIRGEDRRAAGTGHATITLAPVTFGPGLQPKDLAPIVDGLVNDVAGRLALDGDLAWSADRLDGSAAILVDQLALSAGPARLEQVNGVVRLDRLWPPATPPGQQLAIGLLDLGLPLTQGVMSFQLTPAERLEVAQLEWRFAGGTVRAEPFSLGSLLGDLNVTLRADELDLARLFELTRLEGLTGEGILNGVLPVRLSEGAAVIEDGELAAAGPGVLRYRSETAPAALQAGGQGVDLLLQALENFHYEALRITLDGRTDAAMDIGLHLGGANPDLYDGHPVEFNLDLEGELGNILRQGVASFQIPDRIRERMQGFGR